MLTNAAAKAAGAQARAYKLFDVGGLFLFVAPTGLKSWRLKYRFAGREKLLTIGRFPELSLAQARMRREEAKEILRSGADPGARASSTDTGQTLEQLARSWFRHNLPGWSPAHADDVLGSLERDVFPELGRRAAGAIEPPELLAALRAVEGRGRLTTAQRVRQRLSEIFAFGIAEGLVTVNPAASLGAALRDAPPATPHPALLAIEDCRALLGACEASCAARATVLASRFLALTAVRLDAVRGARWDEIEDLDGAAPLWRVPPARMKLARAKKNEPRFEHLVPLSRAAVAVLREAQPSAGLIFAGRGGTAPVGEGAINALYKRLGYGGRHVPHGWRSSFSTILNEQLGEGWRTTIDLALAHSAKGKVEAAYNRAQLLDRRRELFERWGEMLTA
ncbi:integrase [Altererythrobacter sp. B11]|uniref:tyrosine-type recombinase/integrase n=1 Tax=Altererythrobacter sp. B11 TaxID=2060312 RepID=UPI000DC70A81|nr:integrase arm-type DNA-binding domain-containing protein [Altererythrobacter sp. B11]BBC72937.1 integrase [Altererythrobacter sp. B11]